MRWKSLAIALFFTAAGCEGGSDAGAPDDKAANVQAPPPSNDADPERSGEAVRPPDPGTGAEATAKTEREEPSAPEPDRGEIRVTGRLTDEGVECRALRTGDGQLYTLAGETGGFGTGERVTVSGSRAEISFCQQGITLNVRRIEYAR